MDVYWPMHLCATRYMETYRYWSVDMEKRINKYPLTGFNKISYEELLGILEMLKLFSSLKEEEKEMIMLMMDGLKFRAVK